MKRLDALDVCLFHKIELVAWLQPYATGILAPIVQNTEKTAVGTLTFADSVSGSGIVQSFRQGVEI